MEKKFEVFVKKAARILADAPFYASKRDKVMLLNQKFRLDKKDSELLLKELGGGKK